MKVLVTGAVGALGSHFAERCVQEGHEVFGVDALTPYYDPHLKRLTFEDIEKNGVTVIEQNLLSESLPEDIFIQADFIVHFAAQPGIASSVLLETYVENNITATHRVLELARKSNNLRGFINISTSSVYGVNADGDEKVPATPTSLYGVTKLAGEQLALSYFREYGLPVTSLRFFSVYGERERPDKLYRKLIEAIAEGHAFPLYVGSEHHVRSYTYVQDIIDGCMMVLNDFDKARGEIFNLGTDVTHTTGEGIALVEELLGKKALIEEKPPRTGDQKETRAHIAKMREVFGYNPTTTLREGLQKEVDWYLAIRDRLKGVQ